MLKFSFYYVESSFFHEILHLFIYKSSSFNPMCSTLLLIQCYKCKIYMQSVDNPWLGFLCSYIVLILLILSFKQAK